MTNDNSTCFSWREDSNASGVKWRSTCLCSAKYYQSLQVAAVLWQVSGMQGAASDAADIVEL